MDSITREIVQAVWLGLGLEGGKEAAAALSDPPVEELLGAGKRGSSVVKLFRYTQGATTEAERRYRIWRMSHVSHVSHVSHAVFVCLSVLCELDDE